MAPSQTRSSSWVPPATLFSLHILSFPQEGRGSQGASTHFSEGNTEAERGASFHPGPTVNRPPHPLATQRAPYLSSKDGRVQRVSFNGPTKERATQLGSFESQAPKCHRLEGGSPSRFCQAKRTQAQRGKESRQPASPPQLPPLEAPPPYPLITQQKLP